MLDKTTKETIINSYIKDTKDFSCQNQHYVEACGLYCPAMGIWSIDMGGKLNNHCTKSCKHYIQSGTQIRAEAMINLFNQIKIDTINDIVDYIQNNPTTNNEELIMMLTKEKENKYVKE